MTQFKVGDRVLRKGEPGVIVGVRGGSDPAWEWANLDEMYLVRLDCAPDQKFYALESDVESEVEETDMVNHPPHYKFSNGSEVIEISENLTSNAGQAVQYLARSSRIDGKNKGDTLEDLRKARWLIDREIARLEAH